MGKVVDQTVYKPRILDKALQAYLETFGAVCIEGPFFRSPEASGEMASLRSGLDLRAS